jgi:hypothetical protein
VNSLGSAALICAVATFCEAQSENRSARAGFAHQITVMSDVESGADFTDVISLARRWVERKTRKP